MAKQIETYAETMARHVGYQDREAADAAQVEAYLVEDINETNAHRALWLSETYVSPEERRWDRWVKQVEKLLGHSLDGNQATDGYSFDYAFDAFEAGDTPAEHLVEIRAQQAAL